MNPNLAHQRQSHSPQLTQHRIVDPQNGGVVVSSFAHPSGWQAHSQVVWNPEHTNLPALVMATAFNPDGMESFEFLPTQVFYWIDGDLTGVPIGQNAHGLVRMSPRSAPDALANLVIPHFRGDRQNLRVNGVQPMQSLGQIFNDPPPQQGESLMARVEYEERGQAIEEEFYGVYEWVPVMPGTVNWGFGRLFCFRAARGQLDAMRQTFWQIAGSLQPNPQWKQIYDQVVQKLMAGHAVKIKATYDRFDQERQIGLRNIHYNDQLIEQRNAQVNASIERTQQQIHARSQYQYTRQVAFGDGLLGRTAYEDPNSDFGNLHYEYGHPEHVWRNDRNEWLPTNDASYNPNQDQNQNGNWVKIEPLKPTG
jgi:hypothetical protein